MLADEKTVAGGVVTFLDVLGWKGVYDRIPEAIAKLRQLVEGIRDESLPLKRGRTYREIEVKSISDTIAIFTLCNIDEASNIIEIHGKLCQWAIPQSIELEIPVRGATAFGEFEFSENIFVGKAVDEAASWHEHIDWIGVNLTPSAEFLYSPVKDLNLWRPYKAPNKSKIDWTPRCVDWTANWGQDREVRTRNIKDKFRRLGPIVPEISGKFIHTLAFIEKMGAPHDH